jgi:hypothetical protein
MISKDNTWLYSQNAHNILMDERTKGKWIREGKLSKRDIMTLDALVEQGAIYSAKYAHKEQPDRDPLPFSPPVLCVYADDGSKERTRELLQTIGLQPLFWKYNWETIRDWQPGGELYEESRSQRALYFCHLLDKTAKNENS